MSRREPATNSDGDTIVSLMNGLQITPNKPATSRRAATHTFCKWPPSDMTPPGYGASSQVTLKRQPTDKQNIQKGTQPQQRQAAEKLEALRGREMVRKAWRGFGAESECRCRVLPSYLLAHQGQPGPSSSQIHTR